MAIEDAFLESESRYKAAVMYSTWGHLEPQVGSYNGAFLFYIDNWRSQHMLSFRFPFDGGPGFYDDILKEVYKLSDKLDNVVGVYSWVGKFKRYKNGSSRFVGKIKKLIDAEKLLDKLYNNAAPIVQR